MQLVEVMRLFDRHPDVPLILARTALIDIDVQNVQVYGLADRVRAAGLGDIYDYYTAEVAGIIPKIRRLKDACRRAGIDVIHLRCASYTGDGRDCCPLFQSVDIKATDLEADSEIVANVAPQEGEIVLSKVSAGAFNGSDIDIILRNLGKDTLICTGLVTAGCVDGTVRGAADRGYRVFLVKDACASWTSQQHAASIRILGQWFATLVDTEEVLRRIDMAIDPRQSSDRYGQQPRSGAASQLGERRDTPAGG
jgi:nicotinamidase-related amidase